MKSTIAFAAVVARLAAAQDFDFAAVLDAPSPSLTAPPLTAATDATSIYSVETSSLSASIVADVVTAVATASVTGASASAASTQTPDASDASAVDKRGLLADVLGAWGYDVKTTSTTSAKSTLATSTKSSSTSSVKATTTSSAASSSKTSSSSSIQLTTSSASSTTVQSSSTSTTSSSTACPTQIEAGTYCGFINPEDPCAIQPDGYGPQVQPDTVAAFQAYPEFHQDAKTAPTPFNYSLVFQDLNAATSANSYLGFYTLDSYNTTECAAHCDSTDLCTAFNIYVERDPSLNPTALNTSWTNYWNGSTDTYGCPNPASISNYKCSLWGSNIDNTSATNTGGERVDFQVTIAGSNGYDKTNNTIPAPIPSWTAPTNCSAGGAISGGNYWMGSNFFPGPFDPSVCGIYAQAQTSKNKQVAISKGANSYTPCNMFNAYAIHKNGVPQGTYCALYDAVLSSEWAAFMGAWSGSDFFGVHSSWTYSLSHLDSGKC